MVEEEETWEAAQMRLYAAFDEALAAMVQWSQLSYPKLCYLVQQIRTEPRRYITLPEVGLSSWPTIEEPP